MAQERRRQNTARPRLQSRHPYPHADDAHAHRADEIVSVRDFEVAICRMSSFDTEHGDRANYTLVAKAGAHWYQVARWTDVDGARRIAAKLERPCERTHGLRLGYETRSASLTPELYRLTGQTTVSKSFMRVLGALPGSAFEIGAEYDSPLDARHPRRISQADLDADARRRAALYPLWQPRMADAYELSLEVYGLGGDVDEPGASAPRR